MAKSNMRSFRYDDDIAKILEDFNGDSYNEKFENLVNYCHKELPKVQKRVKQAEAELNTLEKKCATKSMELVNLNQLEMEHHAMQLKYTELMEFMQRFADRAKKVL